MNMNLGCESSTSSPPTPPSPLPISFGPGNRRYSFSASSTPSPPFSPPSSTHTSAETLPLLPKTSVFSLDYRHPQELDSKSTCLKDLFDSFHSKHAISSVEYLSRLRPVKCKLEWFVQRCCSCCKEFPPIFLTPHNSSRIQCSG